MADIKTKELSKELIVKAMQCETPEELIELAKEEGVELTQEEAEAYLAELEDFELSSNDLKQVAGGEMDDTSRHCESYDNSWCSIY